MSQAAFYRRKIQKLRKKKNVKVKESLEIMKGSIYPIFDLTEKSKSRKKKQNDARKEQKDWNEKNSKEHFCNKAHCNFDSSDYVWHVTFNDKHRPETEEESDKIFKNLIKGINRYRKKFGLGNARYMAVIEYGKSGKLHWHILIDGDIHRDILETFWKYGNSNVDRLKINDEGIKDLCKYMLKDPKGRKRWKQSRGNLVNPPDPVINDNVYTKRQMLRMTQAEPTKEELEAQYPGYTLTQFNLKVDEVYGGIYVNFEMRKIVKNNLYKNNKKEVSKRRT